MHESSSNAGCGSAFPTTQWTVIIDAVSSDPERVREALEKLCDHYRQPIVNWFRRKDFYQEPEDLAHAFIAYLLKKNLLNRVAPRTGKFRCFLAACMWNFLRDSWDQQSAERNPGMVPLDGNEAGVEAAASSDSDLDVDFAVAIHERVMAQLAPREELKRYIFQKDSSEGWDQIAERLNKTSTAVRKEVSRLRRRHWEIFRDEVAQIVTPASKAQETRYLYNLLFRNLPME